MLSLFQGWLFDPMTGKGKIGNTVAHRQRKPEHPKPRGGGSERRKRTQKSSSSSSQSRPTKVDELEMSAEVSTILLTFLHNMFYHFLYIIFTHLPIRKLL